MFSEQEAKLIAENQRMRAALEAVEWVPDGEGWSRCPWCRVYEEYGDGHKPDCARQAALSGALVEAQDALCVCGHRRDTHTPLCVYPCGCDEFKSLEVVASLQLISWRKAQESEEMNKNDADPLQAHMGPE